MHAETAKDKDLPVKLSHLQDQVQRLYHIRERIETMHSRMCGPHPKPEKNEGSPEAEVSHFHMSELQRNISRLADEVERIEGILQNLEETI